MSPGQRPYKDAAQLYSYCNKEKELPEQSGDIIGSPFEFDRGDKTKEFDLFTKGCDFTDDSVMTIAVGEALLAVGTEATVKKIEEAVVTNMQDWGKRYPYAGYGGRFRYWFRERNPKPYGSYGNGSAMRVSAAGCGARIVFGEKGE